MISVEISQLLGDLYPRPRKKKQTALVPKELQLSAFLSIGNSIRYVIILLLLTASAMWISVSYRYVMRVQECAAVGTN
ncbi:unnamed protein product [Cyprideis torosa]|uniref:Uncharacterized protein n=1 Tax=Cyprideis torosa TaxID=163714 RepID=A0A7R9A032_9CRUS|nr:unnamed protein product [Cyprideis torosa]CAG0910404.1 unnamed protein product [Cyprideis torosa]